MAEEIGMHENRGEDVEVERVPTEGVRIIGAEEAAKIMSGEADAPANTVEPGEFPATESAVDESVPGQGGPLAQTPGFLPGSAPLPARGGVDEPPLFTVHVPDVPGQGAFEVPETPPGGMPGNEMPHWTEPATGEVPAVLASESAEEGGDSWSGSGPSWQDGGSDWGDDYEHAQLADDDTDIGALDESRMTAKELFSFDDIGEPSGPVLRSGIFGEAPGSGSIETYAEEGAASALFDAGGPGEVGGEPAQGGGLPGVGSVVGERPTVRIAPRRPGEPPPGTSGETDQPPDGSSAGDGEDFFDDPARGRPARGRPGTRLPASGEDDSFEVPTAGRNLGVAIATGLGFGALVLITFKIGAPAALVLVTAVISAAIFEFYAVAHKVGLHPASLLGLVGTVCILAAAYMRGESGVVVVLAIMVPFSLLWYLWGVTKARAAVSVGITLLGFAWISFLGSFAGLLLSPHIHPNGHGVALLLGAVVATVFYDVGAYAIGSRSGRHPLLPEVSPNKTWEGLIGGMALAIVSGAVLGALMNPWTVKRGIMLGVVVAVAAPLGDLCQSLLKRDLGIKDMSSILPGHGGILDRIDAMLFVMPAVYFLAGVLPIA